MTVVVNITWTAVLWIAATAGAPRIFAFVPNMSLLSRHEGRQQPWRGTPAAQRRMSICQSTVRTVRSTRQPRRITQRPLGDLRLSLASGTNENLQQVSTSPDENVLGEDEEEQGVDCEREGHGGEMEEEEEVEDDSNSRVSSTFKREARGVSLDLNKILAETEYMEQDSYPKGFRTGFVTIVGSPNVGKSTLMNNMIGDHLSIVTPKAGTTRHRITGIMTGDDFQLVYQDTPGVLTPAYKLHEGMMGFVNEAMGDADVLLFVTDIFETEFSSPQVFQRMLDTRRPIVVAVNKIDLLPSDGEQGDGKARPSSLSETRLAEVGSLSKVLARWEDRLPGATLIPISALEGINTAKLANELKQRVPEGAPLFGNDVMSDKPQRFFAAEIIREQIFGSFAQEIPYSCEVVLESFEERRKEIALQGTIVVSQQSQKGMVIGKGGAKIKEVGIKARNALEEFLGKRVDLRLKVTVDKNWRKKEASLKAYGYL